MTTANKRTCKAENKRGERCKAPAVERGLCVAHAGLVDMQAIGRKGGRVRPLTRLRARADDDLREQARQTLSDALSGKDVPKPALDAARSLFSYRADAPPAAADRVLGDGPLIDGHRPTSLGDVMKLAAELNQLEAMPDVVEAARAIVARAEAGGAAGFARESRSIDAESLPDERIPEQSENGNEAA